MSDTWRFGGPVVEDTSVTFPRGEVRADSVVLAAGPAVVGSDHNTIGVVTRESPFHPLDHTWPDQPADHGMLTIDGANYEVITALTGAVRKGTTQLAVGDDIRVRRGDPEWSFVVVHAVRTPSERDAQTLVGKAVTLAVDAGFRGLVSQSHTGCHLMALALNAATRELWRKETRSDSLGHPDLDQAAIAVSTMDDARSRDEYRFGKSLRKSGFDTAGFYAGVSDIAAAMTEQLRRWLATDSRVGVDSPHDGLSARRLWTCQLPEGLASIPCGGTHVPHLGIIESLTLSIEADADLGRVVVLTTPGHEKSAGPVTC